MKLTCRNLFFIICNFSSFLAPNEIYSVKKTNFAQTFMNFVADAIVFWCSFVLFLSPWYGQNSLIGLNYVSLCFGNDVEHTQRFDPSNPLSQIFSTNIWGRGGLHLDLLPESLLLAL